jgi:formate hydrogenlyase subunit 4
MFIFAGVLIRLGLLVFFQPFRDAIKFFTMEQYFPLVSNFLICYLSPIFCLDAVDWTIFCLYMVATPMLQR